MKSYKKLNSYGWCMRETTRITFVWIAKILAECENTFWPLIHELFRPLQCFSQDSTYNPMRFALVEYWIDIIHWIRPWPYLKVGDFCSLISLALLNIRLPSDRWLVRSSTVHFRLLKALNMSSMKFPGSMEGSWRRSPSRTTFISLLNSSRSGH